jgi:hypothetical protein
LVEHQLPKLRVAGSIPVVRLARPAGSRNKRGPLVGPRFRLQVRASYKRKVKPLLSRAPKRPPNVSSRREPHIAHLSKRRFARDRVRRDSAQRREKVRRYHGASAEVEKVNARLEAGHLDRALVGRDPTALECRVRGMRREEEEHRDATDDPTDDLRRKATERIERESRVHRRYGPIFAVSRKAQASACQPCKDQSRCR